MDVNDSELTADARCWILRVKKVWKTSANTLHLYIPFQIYMIVVDNKGLSEPKGALSKRIK